MSVPQSTNPVSPDSATLSFTSTPAPHYAAPPLRIATIVADLRRLRDENRELTIQRDDAERRSILLQRENAVLRAKLNVDDAPDASILFAATTPAPDAAPPHPPAPAPIWSTAGEDWDLPTDRTARKQRKAQKSHSRALTADGSDAAGSDAVLADPETAVFSGSLWSYNTAAVRIIAHALSIPTTGIKPELVKRVSEYLDAHRELEDNPRFTGLYTAKYRHPAYPPGAATAPQKRPAPVHSPDYPPPPADQPMYSLAGAIDPHLAPPPTQRRRVDGQEGDEVTMGDPS